MKLFNWESIKKTNKEIEQANIPIHEELDRDNNPTKSLDTEIYQPEVTEEENRIKANDPEKKFIPVEDLPNSPDDFDWSDYNLEEIDESEEDGEDLMEIKAPATTHLPPEIREIVQKYSLPNEDWQKLSKTERQNRLNQIKTEIAEKYLTPRRKKMVPKNKNVKESTEKAA